MLEIDRYDILAAGLAVFGIAAILLHIRYYQDLYSSLNRRGVVGDAFAPDWSSKLGALGCMGFITRIKKEIGMAKLDAIESCLVPKVVISYYVATIATFVAVCLIFWRIYGA